MPCRSATRRSGSSWPMRFARAFRRIRSSSSIASSCSVLTAWSSTCSRRPIPRQRVTVAPSIRRWASATFGCSKNTRRGSAAWRSVVRGLRAVQAGGRRLLAVRRDLRLLVESARAHGAQERASAMRSTRLVSRTCSRRRRRQARVGERVAQAAARRPANREAVRVPQTFAEQIFARVERLRVRASNPELGQPGACSLFVGERWTRRFEGGGDSGPSRPLHPIVGQRKSRRRAKPRLCDQAQLLKERVEGYFVVSYETPGGCVAITKDLLTEVLGRRPRCEDRWTARSTRSRDCRLMCRDLVSQERKAPRTQPRSERSESIESLAPDYIIAARRSRFAHVTRSRVVAKL